MPIFKSRAELNTRLTLRKIKHISDRKIRLIYFVEKLSLFYKEKICALDILNMTGIN